MRNLGTKFEKFLEMKEMERNTFEMYWSYYLSIEKMMRNTSQYVAPSKQNSNTYSDEFMKIILLSCSEIDSILKVICKENGVMLDDKKYNMSVYADTLLKQKDIKEWAFSPESSTSSRDCGILCFPFRDLDAKKAYGGLSWWGDYQKLKHNRLDNAEVGNLENAVFAITAHFILLRILMDMLSENNGREYVKEKYWSDYLIICI